MTNNTFERWCAWCEQHGSHHPGAGVYDDAGMLGTLTTDGPLGQQGDTIAVMVTPSGNDELVTLANLHRPECRMVGYSERTAPAVGNPTLAIASVLVPYLEQAMSMRVWVRD